MRIAFKIIGGLVLAMVCGLGVATWAAQRVTREVDLVHSAQRGSTAAIDGAVIESLAIGAGFIVIVAGVGTVLSLHLTKRVRRLRDYAAAIGAGRSETLDVGGADELAELATTLRQMAHDLETARAEQERQRQLAVERESMQATIRANEQVLGVIGHELRTPLAAMRLTAEHLQDQLHISDPGLQAMLHSLQSETVRLADLVSDTLEASRLGSGSAQWTWSEFDVREITERLPDLVRHTVREGVRLVIEVDPPDLKMRGDSSAIGRLLINLLTNAARHTTEGSIHVTMSSEAPTDGVFVLMRVRDTGSGISPEIAERLGEPFVLNAGVVGRNFVSGAGLGLSICRAIIAAHGGSMSVTSSRGIGTTFAVRVRADLPQAAANELSPIDVRGVA
ncbi:MAG: HAMP domain-containing sensor histidine kinase [Planctomycetota bacterium]